MGKGLTVLLQRPMEMVVMPTTVLNNLTSHRNNTRDATINNTIQRFGLLKASKFPIPHQREDNNVGGEEFNNFQLQVLFTYLYLTSLVEETV